MFHLPGFKSNTSELEKARLAGQHDGYKRGYTLGFRDAIEKALVILESQQSEIQEAVKNLDRGLTNDTQGV